MTATFYAPPTGTASKKSEPLTPSARAPHNARSEATLKRRAQTTTLCLAALFLACGSDEAALLTPLADGQPSGIESCDQFLQLACDCAAEVPAAKTTCDLAKQSKNGWHAAAGISAQKAAASQACTIAKTTLDSLLCKKP
jgi:hypothetical protein